MKRLVDEGGDDFAAELLRSAAKDAPSAEALARATEAAVAGAPAPGLPTWLKIAGLGTVVVGVAAALAIGSARPDPPVPPTMVAPPVQPTAVVEVPPPPATASFAPIASETAPIPSATAVSKTPDPTVSADDLPRELAALDRARSAIAAKDGSLALQELGGYFKEFPKGTLHEEAEAMQVQALIVSGQTARAQSAGQAFLAAHASSPHARRVRTLLQSLQDGGP